MIKNWRDAAVGVIDECLKDIIQYVGDEAQAQNDVRGTVRNSIKSKDANNSLVDD